MGNGFRAALKIGALAVLARLLDPEAFGVVGAAMVVVWLSMIFSTLGAGHALVRLREITPHDMSTAFIASAALGVVFGALVAALAPLAARLLQMPPLVPVLQVLAIAFPVAGLGIVAEARLQRELRFRAIATVETLSYGAGYALVGIAMAAAGAGVWALVAAELSKVALKIALFLFLAPPPSPRHFDLPTLRRLMRFGSRYTLGNLCIYLSGRWVMDSSSPAFSARPRWDSTAGPVS